MKGGVILIVIALLIGYAAITGKYKCFTVMFECLLGLKSICEGCGGEDKVGALGGARFPVDFPALQPLKPLVIG
jgi:hypothetical protein